MTTADRRLLLVHAHPDDETINNGATMAMYAAAGAGVTLVTCTRGEEGEILVPELEHLAAGKEDRLGEHRETELAAAMAALGVSDHRFLGAAGHGFDEVRYRDSGMAYDEERRVGPVADLHPDAFALAPVDAAAARLAAELREVRPHVLVTYDPDGGYGHPDHVQAHRVAMRAVDMAADGAGGPGGPAWDVPKIYWIALPEGLVRTVMEQMAGADNNPFEGWDAGGRLPSMIIPDEEVTTAVDASTHVEAKMAALRAHATQISVNDGFFALSDGVGQPLAGTEFYRLVKGSTGPDRDADGRESSLFSGL